MDIILYLLNYINYQRKIIGQLLNFICRYIPLKQWAFDDSHSPKYQKFKVDKLPKIISHQQDWTWKYLIPYYQNQKRYGKTIKPVFRRVACDITSDCTCPMCKAPVDYLHNLRKVDKEDLEEDYGKNKYKLHYIYREFTIDFFKMDLSSLPKNASSLKFKQHDSYIMSLCLTYRVNLGLSLRKTAQALKDIHGIKISHQQVANYCTTAAICVKPFTDSYDYNVGKVLTADETYIKIRGVKGYIWFIMDAAKRSILGYQISDNRGVGPYILSYACFQFL